MFKSFLASTAAALLLGVSPALSQSSSGRGRYYGWEAYCYVSRYEEIIYDDPSCTTDVTVAQDGSILFQLYWSDGVETFAQIPSPTTNALMASLDYRRAYLQYRSGVGADTMIMPSVVATMGIEEKLSQFICLNHVEQDDVYCFRLDS